MHSCPSGLRGSTQVRVYSYSWVQIPQNACQYPFCYIQQKTHTFHERKEGGMEGRKPTEVFIANYGDRPKAHIGNYYDQNPSARSNTSKPSFFNLRNRGRAGRSNDIYQTVWVLLSKTVRFREFSITLFLSGNHNDSLTFLFIKPELRFQGNSVQSVAYELAIFLFSRPSTPWSFDLYWYNQ